MDNKTTYQIVPITVFYLNRDKPGVMIKFSDWYEGVVDTDILEQMSIWGIQYNCGHRIGYNDFIFDNEKQRTMFILKWA